MHNPTPRYNASDNESNLNLSQGQLRSTSASTPKTLKHEDLHTIMLYVLTSLDDVQPYCKIPQKHVQYAITIRDLTHFFLIVTEISSSILATIKGTYPAGIWYPS